MNPLSEAELGILDWIAAHCQSAWMDVLMPAITWLGDSGMVWILLGFAILLFSRKERATGFQVLTGLLSSGLSLYPWGGGELETGPSAAAHGRNLGESRETGSRDSLTRAKRTPDGNRKTNPPVPWRCDLPRAYLAGRHRFGAVRARV